MILLSLYSDFTVIIINRHRSTNYKDVNEYTTKPDTEKKWV
jgi:hypothetical protein